MHFNMKKSLLLATMAFSFTSNFLLINHFEKNIRYSNFLQSKGESIYKIIEAKPQGDVALNKEISNLGYNHSQFTPTGIFVTKSSAISIYCPETTGNVYAFIGQWGSYKFLNDGKKVAPKQIALNQGSFTIINPDIDGMLYISNQSFDTNVSITITVINGLSVPTFKVNETTSENFNEELKTTNSPFVELIGENVFGTFQISLANELWKNNLAKINKLNETIKNWDEIYKFSNYANGLSLSFDGVAQKHHNLIHITNPDFGPGYASATNYFVTFQQDTNAGRDLFNLDKSEQWGLWHEIGHTYQNQDYKFDDFGEVSGNINSFWVQEELGFRNRLFTEGWKDTAINIKNLINSTNPNKSIYDLDIWGRLGLYLQLHMAYGKEFFPTLNQKYRLLTPEEKPKTNAEKFQTFIKLTSKVANRNLIPFFEKWGIHPDDSTKKAVENYPLLAKDIWNNIFDNHFEENAIIDYYLKKYDPVSQVKVSENAMLVVDVGSRASQIDVEKHLINLSSDMRIDKTMAPDWNSINWDNSSIFNYSGVNISQPNKISNKYLIPTRVMANNSVRILGLGDSYHGITGLNNSDKKFFISPEDTALHSYFKGEPYVRISISDEKENLIYQVTANGDDTTIKFQELNNISYSDNYQIKFWFAEPARGLYYYNGNWIKAENSNVNGEITFVIINNNFVKI